MNQRPRVLVDVDGVAADFAGATSRTLEALGGTPFTGNQVVDWDLTKLLGDYEPKLLKAWRSEGWCRDIDPYPGSIEGIAKLQKVADVFFVTAPFYESPHWAWERLNWLKCLYGATDYQVSFTHAKYIVQGDFMVEDRPKNILAWAAAHPNSTMVIWDQPYTRTMAEPVNSFRTRDWDALVERVGSWEPTSTAPDL